MLLTDGNGSPEVCTETEVGEEGMVSRGQEGVRTFMVTRFERDTEEGSGCVVFGSGVAERGAFGGVGGSVPLLVSIVSGSVLASGTVLADEMPGESYECLTGEGESTDRLRDGPLREVRLRLGEGKSVSM